MSLRDRFRPVEPAPPPAAGERAEARAALELSRRRGHFVASAAPPAAKAVAAVLRPMQPKTRSVGLRALQNHWTDIIGQPFASTTYPVKLAAGVLTLRVQRASALMVQHAESLLVERVNRAGAKISTLRIEQGSLPVSPKAQGNVRPLKRPLAAADEAALAQALDHVGDPGLKSALMRLGRAVKQG